MQITNFKKKEEDKGKEVNLPKREESVPVIEKAGKKQLSEKKEEQLRTYGFQKGQSGNPSGRPKGSLNFTSAIKRQLGKEIEFIEKSTGNKVKKKMIDILAEKLVEKARVGDMRAMEYVGNRVDGKPKETLDLEGNITGRVVLLPERGGNK